MNPKTGEIYAMATNHGYDLSDPYNVSSWYDQDEVDALSEEEQAVVYNDMWSNFCVSYAFELGSTFKPITVSAALETGSINPDDTFYCDGLMSLSLIPGSTAIISMVMAWRPYGRPFRTPATMP